ncbi:MAG: DUF2924 domain-containing protein [Hyphomonas sp.]|nr:DUF2924 domain-containing protein [Hyphomonas sp.]
MSLEDDLAELSRKDLKERWEDIIGLPPPPRIARVTMIRILTCELQWQTCGQSRAAIIKKLERVLAGAEKDKPIANSGTRLVREWNGREHVVDITDEGYLWNGRFWRSLSAIAKEITGAKWSGPRFFGVAA